MADGFSHGVLYDRDNVRIAHFHPNEEPDCRSCIDGVPYIPRPATYATGKGPISPEGVDHRHKVLCHWCRMGVADTGTPKAKKKGPS